MLHGQGFKARERLAMKRFSLISVKGQEFTKTVMNVALGKESADMAIVNATLMNVYTGEFQEHCAVAVKGGWIAYVGDDLLDLPILRQVGFAIAVENAHPIVKQHVHWVTPRAGGHGAGRDVCDKVMTVQGTLDGLLQRYL